MKKYNRSEIMKRAWNDYKFCKEYFKRTKLVKYAKTFSECLKKAWEVAKAIVKAEEEREAQGIVRMSYAEYKKNYSNNKTVDNSYDKRTKTIEVMTKVLKSGSKIVKMVAKNGLCPICGTYCYGDCIANA